MDETKDKDVAVGSVSVSGSGNGSEVKVVDVAGEVAVGSESVVSEGVGEDGGACNGDELMVEVFGSNVYVGGVCTSEGGDEPGDEVGREESVYVETGSKGNVRSGGGNGGEVSEDCRIGPVRRESLKGAEATAVASSTGGETRVVSVEKSEVEMVAREDAKTREGSVTDEKARDDTYKKQIGGLFEQAFGRGFLEVVKQEKKVVDGGVDLKTQKINVADDEQQRVKIEPVKVIRRGEIVDGDNIRNSEKDQLRLEETVENSIAQVELKEGQGMEVDNKATTYPPQSKTNVLHEIGVTDTELDSLSGARKDMELERDATDREHTKASEDKVGSQEAMQPGGFEIVTQPRYELPPKNEGVFSASDLVWGKVKSHPWWPGQIFDFIAASEKAMKHHKKDCFLVAYFGDRTFAWNEVSTLKPFQSYFSQAQKQCNSETFHKAVNSVLKEVSRRVELGLSCSCIPKDVYEKIRVQIIENAGICHESSKIEGVDESAISSSFESNKLLQYIKALARFPSGDRDQLEYAIAKAHLLAFFRLKGYYSLPEFQFCGDLLESTTDISLSRDKTHLGEMTEHATFIVKDGKKTSTGPEIVEVKSSSSNKRKHNLREGVYAKMKERTLSELMDGETGSVDDDDWFNVKATSTLVSPSSGKRRKCAESHAVDLNPQDGRKGVTTATISNITPVQKQSFKIGECIQRAASQLTGSTIVKSNIDRPAGQGSDVSFQSSDDTSKGRASNPAKYSSLDELLSQLQLAAEDPLKKYNSSSAIVNFFSDFRNSVAVGQNSGLVLSVEKVSGRKRKSSNSVPGLPETFEFDDMNDTYWTDMVIQNGAEEQPSRKRKTKYQPVVVGQPEKSPPVARRPYNRKRQCQGSQALLEERPVGYVDENAPAELIMNFSEVNSVPSEKNLNKMFKRFGPLKEYETEVDRESSRARVVFKRCSDAEVAYNSAGKFNIFGQIAVTYQLNYTPSQFNYTPSITFSASTSATTQGQEMQLIFPTNNHEMHLDLSTHDQMQLDLSTHDQMQLDLSTHDHMQLDLSTHDEMQLDLSTFEVNLV